MVVLSYLHASERKFEAKFTIKQKQRASKDMKF